MPKNCRQTNANYWIKKLALQPHPEGGYYRETYRAAERISAASLPKRYRSARVFSSAILFLLAGNQISVFHRLKSDEIWHFHAGQTLILFQITTNGKLTETRLGARAGRGEQFQAVIPAGNWMGARPLNRHSWALIGCTVAPGFDFADFELADRLELTRQFPQHQRIIKKLTQKNSLSGQHQHERKIQRS